MLELTLHRPLSGLLHTSLAATGALTSCGGTDVSLFEVPLCTANQGLSVTLFT